MVRIHAAFITVICVMLACFLCMPGSLRAQEGADSGTDSSGTVSEYTLNDFYFDTVVSIRFDAGENGDDLTDGCRSICDEIEHIFSRTSEESELYAVNHRDSDRVEVSAPLAEVVQTGLDYYRISDGRFDITIAPVAELWDFHGDDPVLPQEEEIQNALRKVDGSSVHVEKEGDAWYLTFDHPDTMLDLGGLAKGYAADRLTEYLKSQGVTSGLVNLGGNVAAIGAKADGSPWKVGIQNHHILDPATGYPVSNGLWGVTIISDSSLQGDALSTVCLLIGQEEAMDLIRQTDGVQAVFVDDRLQVTECE